MLSWTLWNVSHSFFWEGALDLSVHFQMEQRKEQGYLRKLFKMWCKGNPDTVVLFTFETGGVPVTANIYR